MNRRWENVEFVGKIAVGCALFALGFNLFLEPNGLNAGGISGLAMVFVHLAKFGSVGLFTILINLPLFAISGLKIGKKFVVGSLIGMLISSLLLDAMALLPCPETEPLVGALYGGVLCGIGIGLVFSVGASTGGSDIVVRLLKLKWRNTPIGSIAMGFDLVVAVLTGLAFWDISRTLYSGVAIFVTGVVMDAVVYRFDYSKVVMVISKQNEIIAKEITQKLDRGVTYLEGEGYYSGNHTKVVLSVVKRQQLAELKQLVVDIDPDAFIIVQEAHQVLGDGFSRYTKDSL